MLPHLTMPEEAYLRNALARKKLPPAICLSHVDLVLALADNRDALAVDIMEKLLDKPIYICARGETSVIVMDEKGRVVPTPRGHYRGMPPIKNDPGALQFRERMRNYMATIDNRILTSKIKNPKKRGSKAHTHFEQYTVGKSLHWHRLNTEVTAADIRFDVKNNYITVVSPVEYAQMAELVSVSE